MDADDPRHGFTRGYYAGCRLPCCRAAMSAYEKRNRYLRHHGLRRSVPAIGAQRRIQALMRLGWTTGEIAEACGWSHRNQVLKILNGQNRKPCTWVERKTHNTLARAYEQMAMKTPPPTPYRARSIKHALAKRYLPPLSWDDIDTDLATTAWANARDTREWAA